MNTSTCLFGSAMRVKGYIAVNKVRILLTTDYINKLVTYKYSKCIIALLTKFLTDMW